MTFEEKIPDWDYKGTTHLEEMVLVTQNYQGGSDDNEQLCRDRKVRSSS
ncbi:MAG: hypothetical protein MZV63_16085 [Marinilabiliales bacterium]|nr:hypothetical protein [Marinilabiliales bacterium]